MEKKRKHVLDYAIFCVVFLIVFCTCLSSACGSFIKQGLTPKDDFSLSEEWRYADGTMVTEDNRYNHAWDQSGALSVFKTVTEDDFGKALYFRNHRQDVTVIADGIILYDTYGDGRNHLRHCFNGYCMAVLPSGEAEYTVELRMGATSNAPCTIPVIFLDDPGLIEAALFQKSAPVLLQSMIFLTIAVLSFCVGIMILLKKGRAAAILYGSGYIICQTLWALCDIDMINIISISNEFTDTAGYFLIVLRVTLLMAFGREFVAKERRKPMELCIWGLNLFQLIQGMLYLLGICRLYDLHKASMAVSSISLIVFSLSMICEVWYERSLLTGILTVGVIINTVMIILSQIIYLSPVMTSAYQKAYRPFMLINDTVIVFVLIVTDILSGVQTVKDELQSAKKLASQAQELRLKVDLDSLTGLMNHRAIMECVEKCARGTKAFAVGFVDLDDFRDINTKYGHLVGDQVLRFVAKTMRNIFQSYCGRPGGDEFMFLLEDEKQINALEQLLKQYQHMLNQEFILRDTEEHIAIKSSIGVVLVRELPQDCNTIINKADDLMYRAKAKGKDQFVVEEL